MKLFLKSLILALVAFVVALPALAFAQAVADPAPSFNDLIQAALGTVSTWKAAGWIAGSLALVNVLMNTLKYEPLAKFLTSLKIGWWLRPVLALVLGIAAGVLSSVVGGAPVGISILVALLSGLGSTGFHELITAANERVRAERGVGALIVGSVTKATTDASTTEAQELTKKLEAISAMPAEGRLAALAELGKKA